ncbi:hypothetical protein E2542_SST27047 [Spatholobus suberectus]|nr:hypothetical protein E2542_SST27047 [Spatholobus suberectus]
MKNEEEDGLEKSQEQNVDTQNKSRDFSPKWQWKLPSWSTVGAEEISGGVVKCLEIEKNTNGESTLLSRH